jgi:micrococcal nuclease
MASNLGMFRRLMASLPRAIAPTIVLLSVLIGLLSLGGCGTSTTSFASVNVVRVVSGQTIEVTAPQDPTTVISVRLIGLDAPDLEQFPWGHLAQTYLTDRLTNQAVGLEFDIEQKDRFGRSLAYVWLGERLINQELIAKGFALAQSRSPNLRYDNRLVHAQLEARALEKGIWNPDQALRQSPAEFRQQTTNS